MYVISQLGGAEDRNIAIPVAVVDGPTLRAVLGPDSDAPVVGKRFAIEGVIFQAVEAFAGDREERRDVR